jgi:ribosomal protein S17
MDQDSMKKKFTIELMREFRNNLSKKHYVHLKTVKTREEAIELTKGDLTGNKWYVGDAYFEVIK